MVVLLLWGVPKKYVFEGISLDGAEGRKIVKAQWGFWCSFTPGVKSARQKAVESICGNTN